MLVFVRAGVVFFNNGGETTRLTNPGEVQGNLVKADVDRINIANQPTPVYHSDQASTEFSPKDPAFGIDALSTVRPEHAINMLQ